jgi:hypothetical protein
MITNHIIRSKPNTNLEKLTNKPEQGAFKNIFVCRNSKAFQFVFNCFKK